MGKSLQTNLPPMALNSLDRNGRAVDTAAPASQSPSTALTSVVADVLKDHFGSLKAAAITFQMDAAQLTRELQTGDFKFRRLEGHADGDLLKARIAHAMLQHFGGDDPGRRVRQLIRDGRRILDELAEAL